MARIARIVLPNHAHLIHQVGADNQQVFFNIKNYEDYLALLFEQCEKLDTKLLSWCLMPNQVYLVLRPTGEKGLARTLGEAHRRYARNVYPHDAKRKSKVWHARFQSCALQDIWENRAIRFVERRLVDAGLFDTPMASPWTSSHAMQEEGKSDLLLDGEPYFDFISRPNTPEDTKTLESHLRTGRPVGDTDWIIALEEKLGRRIRPRKRGRKPKGWTGEE